MIMTCTCKNAAQDALHGVGQRVYNRVKLVTPQVYRCTTCSRERITDQATKAAKAVKKKEEAAAKAAKK